MDIKNIATAGILAGKSGEYIIAGGGTNFLKLNNEEILVIQYKSTNKLIVSNLFVLLNYIYLKN